MGENGDGVIMITTHTAIGLVASFNPYRNVKAYEVL